MNPKQGKRNGSGEPKGQEKTAHVSQNKLGLKVGGIKIRTN
jgi:hypothetical protein